MKPRSLALAATGLIAACSLSACTTNSPSDAAKVNGKSLKMTDMVRLATAYADYQAQSQTDSSTPLTNPAHLPKTTPLGSLRQITNAEITITQVEDRLAARNTPITDEVRKNLRGQYVTQPGWDQLSPLVQDLFVEIGVVKQAVSEDSTISKAKPGESVWVNPELGQFDPLAGIVPLGTPPATRAAATPADTTPTDTTTPSSDAPADTTAGTGDTTAGRAPTTSQP